MYSLGDQEFVHAHFWRKYDFAPQNDIERYDETNEWKPFTSSPQGKNLAYDDSFCFISIASYYGGEYPYDLDAVNDNLPGFYIDTKDLSNIYCYKLDDIKVDCGQDWSFLTLTKEQYEKSQTGKEAGDEEQQQQVEQGEIIITDDEGENKVLSTLSTTSEPVIIIDNEGISTTIRCY